MTASAQAIIVALSLILPAITGTARAADDVDGDPTHWIADGNGCKVHNDNPVAGETILWTGACKDGYVDGPGVLQWLQPDGSPGTRVDAVYVRRIAEGHEVRLSPNRTRFEGTLVHGRANGPGTQRWPNGAVYQGNWIDGKRTGHGTLTRANGDNYEGEFDDGKWTGYGRFTRADGTSYAGAWKDNQREGHGVWQGPDGTKWEGEWKADKAVGDSIPEATRVAMAKSERETFSIKEERTGSHIDHKSFWNLTVPPNKAYGELTADQQALVKANYEAMAPGDEPPYPVHGPARLLKALREVENHWEYTIGSIGELSLVATIGPDGKATKVSVLKAPNPDMGNVMAKFVLLEEYKPAICRGAQCQMDFPFRINLVKGR